MRQVVRHIFAWLKARRTEESVVGFIIHMTAWFSCLGLSIYWWRAWRHLLDTFEAAATAYKWSRWHEYRWAEGLLEVPIHIFSEPIYCLQILAISLVFAFFVNKDGYYRFGSAPAPRAGMGGFGLAAIMMMFRR